MTENAATTITVTKIEPPFARVLASWCSEMACLDFQSTWFVGNYYADGWCCPCLINSRSRRSSCLQIEYGYNGIINMQCGVDIKGIAERMSYRYCHVGRKWAIRGAGISQRPQGERMGNRNVQAS